MNKMIMSCEYGMTNKNEANDMNKMMTFFAAWIDKQEQD